MTKYLVVALGGAMGAVARYWISLIVGERFPTRFPFGTLIINVSGSFIIGFFLTLVTERLNVHPNWRLTIAVGFVGAYTTFSTFEYETFRLLESGGGISGFMNVILSLTLGFLAVWGGIALGRQVSEPHFVVRASLSPSLDAGIVTANAENHPNRQSSFPEASSQDEASGFRQSPTRD